jgi:UDP-2,4-diacetamido-2,4,6-trideoxy-beta-L-altropyranose hydrolase
MSGRVLFRVDGGRGVGLGHLARSLALAHALRERQLEPVVRAPAALADIVAKTGFDLLPLEDEEPGGEQDLERTLAASAGCAAAIVDSYAVTSSFLARLGEATVVAAIDDLALAPFPCRLVVNGGAAASELPYRSAIGGTTFLLGLDYAMPRAELWDEPPRAPADAVRQILVLAGGADLAGLLELLLDALGGLGDELSVTAVIGPYSDAAGLASASRRDVSVVVAPPSMAELMRGADLAVSAGGQTLIELLRAGVPTVAVESAANQKRGLLALARRGLVLSAGAAGDPGIGDRVRLQAERLVSDRALRASLAAAGQSAVDGRGARRVAAALEGLL